MKTVAVDFQASRLSSEDDIENDIREAVARAGHQAGDCTVVSRSGTVGTALIETDPPIVGELSWHGTKVFATT